MSGLGLHILCRATLPGEGRNFMFPMARVILLVSGPKSAFLTEAGSSH